MTKMTKIGTFLFLLSLAHGLLVAQNANAQKSANNTTLPYSIGIGHFEPGQTFKDEVCDRERWKRNVKSCAGGHCTYTDWYRDSVKKDSTDCDKPDTRGEPDDSYTRKFYDSVGQLKSRNNGGVGWVITNKRSNYKVLHQIDSPSYLSKTCANRQKLALNTALKSKFYRDLLTEGLRPSRDEININVVSKDSRIQKSEIYFGYIDLNLDAVIDVNDECKFTTAEEIQIAIIAFSTKANPNYLGSLFGEKLRKENKKWHNPSGKSVKKGQTPMNSNRKKKTAIKAR